MGSFESDGTALVPASALSAAEIVQRVRAGDRALFEILMRRHNQRLYRTARAIRRAVTARIGGVAAGAFQFQAPRCDRVVAAVLAMIAEC